MRKASCMASTKPKSLALARSLSPPSPEIMNKITVKLATIHTLLSYHVSLPNIGQYSHFLLSDCPRIPVLVKHQMV